MVLIRFLIITIAILYILRFIARLLLPMLFQKVMNKAAQQYNAAKPKEPAPRPQGKIQVDFAPPKHESSIADKGEFVEYEELM